MFFFINFFQKLPPTRKSGGGIINRLWRVVRASGHIAELMDLLVEAQTIDTQPLLPLKKMYS